MYKFTAFTSKCMELRDNFNNLLNINIMYSDLNDLEESNDSQKPNIDIYNKNLIITSKYY